ncbi:MAG: LPS assembly protein LptD [Alphaproteobacteria bacterium]
MTSYKDSIRKDLLGAISGCALLVALASPVAAKTINHTFQAKDKKQETLITAQQMTTDQTTGIVTAKGKVEIAHGGYILHADKVTYNQKNGVMRAEGNVTILTPSGEVEFAKKQEISGDMKQAFAENVGILFPDNSRLAAKTVQRYDGRYVVAEKATFTACNVCKEDPDKPPLWEARGETITHDNVEHDVYYHDATIEFAGVPVFYTPYFSAPDPSVTRRQGFLTPTPGVSPNIGNFVHVPYYFDIAPNIDATFAPTFSQNDALQLGGEYRQRFRKGNLELDGSFTRTTLISDKGVNQGDQWRGHLFGNFLYNIDNAWRAGSEVAFTSDKSYLQRYRISSADQLTNRAFVEGFKGRNYAVTNMYYFENLRPGSQPVQPLILPEASFHALGEPGKTLGGRWSFNGSLLVTDRNNKNQSPSQQGPNTRRFSLDTGWERQFTSDTGLVSTLSGMVRGDTYWADNVNNPNGSGNNFNNVTLARHFEQANAIFRYPMGRTGDGYQQLLEPIVALTAAPDLRTSSRQPIEDSIDIEFDETNLFMPNRFTGRDLIESGSRATYGLRHAITTHDGARVDMFGGQSYDFTKNNNFPQQSGLRKNLSDYVGRIDFIPAQWMNLNYGFRLDEHDLSPQRQDALISAGVPEFRPFSRYLSAYQTGTTGILDTVEEVTIGFTSNFAKYWTLSGSHRHALQPQPGGRNSSASLTYADECFIFGITANHDDTQRADISSGTSVVFHFFLKNLGGLHTDSTSSANFPAEFRKY